MSCFFFLTTDSIYTAPPHPSFQLTHVNLNYVLCPAIVDPFRGPYYRTAAVFHQATCLLTLGKIYTLIIRLILSFISMVKAKVE